MDEFNKTFKENQTTVSVYSDNNPANLGINSPYYYFRFDLPSVNLQLTNKSLSPQMLIDHFTSGEQLNPNTQDEVHSSFSNIHLLTQLNINPRRFEMGRDRASCSLITLVNSDLS